MCRWPFFFGPAVPGAIAPVIAPDDWTQEVGVRKCRLYTKPTTSGSGISGGSFSTSSPQTPSASWKVALASEVANTSGLVLDNVNNKVVVPEGVNYVVAIGQLSVLSGSAGNYSVYVKVNGTTKATGIFKISDVYTQTVNTNMMIIPVTEGDEITLEAACDSGSPYGYASGSLTVIVIG